MKGKLFFMILFILPLINSMGLEISNNSLNINKTADMNIQIPITIKNTESFYFYNISFENNPYISISLISNISPNSEINTTLTIFSNNNLINKEIFLKSYYESNLGVSNEIYNISIKYDSGINFCDMQIIRGDSVIWNNEVADSIKLINADTGGEITNILQGSSYTSLFDTPTNLNYYATRRGYQFTNICRINALSDVGIIQNPRFDGKISLNLLTQYESTSIISTFLETNYSINLLDDIEGVFIIKNNGSKIAKNISLSGDWFYFNNNNFDLNPNSSKTVIYYINPYILNTSETNKNYQKNISIKGNFNEIIQEFNIFINYALVNEDNLTIEQSFTQWFNSICSKNPNEPFCINQSKIVYKTPNTSISEEDLQSQIKEIFGYIFELGDNSNLINNYLKEKISEVEENSNKSTSVLLSMEEEREKNNNLIFYTIIVGLGSLTIIGLIFVLLYIKKQQKLNELRRI